MLLKQKKYNKLPGEIIKGYNKIREKSKTGLICHAPFRSIFFSEYGQVLACFYNKKIPLGKYPDNSVLEIWNGSKIKELREYLKHDDLSFGCEDCRRYLLFKNYFAVGAWKYDYLPISGSDYPTSMDFQISNICNLECVMCNGEFSASIRQHRENKIPYDNPYDKNFIKQLEPFIPHLKEAAFTGGETFLISAYYDIWKKFIEINPRILVSITSNGTILNSRVKEILNKLKFNITLSLDSVDKENFERIRKNADLSTVLKNLDFFQDYTRKNQTSFTVKTCPMRQNRHELPAIFDYLNNKNINIVYNTVVFPPYCSLWNLEPAILQETIDHLSSFTFKAETLQQKSNVERYRSLISQIQNWKNESDKKNYSSVLKIEDTEELKNLFLQKIIDYVRNDQTLDQEIKNERINKYTKICYILSEAPGSKQVLNNAFKYYLGLPVERITSEMEIRSIEKLIERTLQAGKESI